MKRRFNKPRREFIKASTIAAAGAVLGQGGIFNKTFGAPSAGWKNGMQINPAIDNLRVAYVMDPVVGAGHMLKKDTYSNWTNAQSASIDQAVVTANMEKLAMALAKKATPGEAWAAIFQKPAAKQWSQVKAAIKVNAYWALNPSLGVVNTLVEALHTLGAPYENITVFDHGDYATPTIYSGKLTGAAVVITHDPQNSATTAITVSDANGSGAMRYLSFLDSIDILISCAVCKSHDQDVFGLTSMGLKNHVGTIWSDVGTRCPNKWATQLTAMNKSPAIIGNPDSAAGIPPRQQLVVVDGIFATKASGYSGSQDCPPPGVIVMGTLAGSVDYLTVHKVRVPIINPVLTDYHLFQAKKFITEFGYDDVTATALLTMDPAADPAGRGWVNALAYVSPAQPFKAGAAQSGLTVDIRCTGRGLSCATNRLVLDKSSHITDAAIYDMSGKMVRRLSPMHSSGSIRIEWNGLTDGGSIIGRGSYLLKIKSGAAGASCTIVAR
jgi:hypothetical protein